MEIYRGIYVEVIEFIKNEVDEMCENHEVDSARNLDNTKWELMSLKEQGCITDHAEIVLMTNDIVGYTYEVIDEEMTIEDVIDNTKQEFETALSFGAMYGSDTQETRLLTDVELEILKNYMSVYTSKLIRNIEKFNNEEK